MTFDRYHLTGVFVYKVLIPALQNTSCKFATDGFLHVLLVHLHFLGETEYLDDILVVLVTDGTQKSCYRQLLLTVNVSVHHVVDVSGELYP